MGDLLALPPEWAGAFDLVAESMTVQALPEQPRAGGIYGRAVPGGTERHAGRHRVRHGRVGGKMGCCGGPPWPLVRSEVESFGVDGVVVIELERVEVPEGPGVLRWRP